MLVAFAATGCSKKAREYSAREALDALAAQSKQVQTVRGRAWVNEKSPEQKMSFPAVVAIDRTNPGAPLMRIEGLDPLGATHVLLVLDSRQRLTWADYDNNKVSELRSNWHGLPLAKLPELVLGIAAPPTNGRVGAANADGFEVRTDKAILHYMMWWIDPGPRLALSELSAQAGAESFTVHYAKYLDKADFYLPEEAELKGQSAELKISWRERRWNETVPPELFARPKSQ